MENSENNFSSENCGDNKVLRNLTTQIEKMSNQMTHQNDEIRMIFKNGNSSLNKFLNALCSYFEQDYDRVIELTSSILQNSNHDSKWRYLRLRGEAYLEKGLFTLAQEDISSSYCLFPTASTVILDAYCRSYLGDISGATECCRVAHEMAPDNMEFLINMAECLIKLKDWSRAISDALDKVIERNLKHKTARLLRAQCHFELDQLELALVDLTFISPMSNQAVLLQAKILLRSDQAEAFKILDRAKKTKEEIYENYGQVDRDFIIKKLNQEWKTIQILKRKDFMST